MTEAVKTKLYKSLPQPNEDKPITVDTFSPCTVLLSRIRDFNGVKIDINIVAVYGYLLGWKKTTGRVTVSIPRISDDCAGISESTVKRARKALKKMGWIDWKTIPDEGKSNTSHCIYTVKDPEDILAELNAGLSQQGDAVVTIAKKHKVTTEESGKDEQKRDVESSVLEPAAPVAGKPDGVPVVDVPVDVDVPANDDAMNASDRYTDEQLGTKLRRWRNWGLDEEAKAFCLSHGISSDEDSMNLFIQNYHVPAPASVEQQVNAPADELPLDHDDPIPF
ncbi:hypothetical protein ACVNAN_004906 [Enterobacter hormaechei]|uniref:hypothetical protein n=1 Tax=Enterobacter cloacae complex TaxID=354276 RepID=UPI00044C6F53|nr:MULTISPECIES: hypothetical protein [Enterobacter cloacae complex]AIE62821.1 hypothetical protein ECNIH2_05400 [Enterobacter cloacae ECNIH2]EJV1265323.1 hypothetical protein [Enterobacter hormaechei]EKS6582023.1 hypothetical protein [Enterobacter hormaechei]EKU3241797.1 hypothetical protein [Enterobacter hormaechei]EKU3242953.1 hypothetical protein [Enterobacter hormaechei]